MLKARGIACWSAPVAGSPVPHCTATDVMSLVGSLSATCPSHKCENIYRRGTMLTSPQDCISVRSLPQLLKPKQNDPLVGQIKNPRKWVQDWFPYHSQDCKSAKSPFSDNNDHLATKSHQCMCNNVHDERQVKRMSKMAKGHRAISDLPRHKA